MIYLGAFLTIVSLATLAVVLLVFRKTRKIHLATYKLLSSAQEVNSLFSQIQAFTALERRLALNEPLPPLRGWAGSPDFLLRVANEIRARQPAIAVECSSGVSTLVIARCLQANDFGHVYSLEHDPEYAGKTRQLLTDYGLSEWATVIDAPLETADGGTPWYSEQGIPSDLAPIDLLVVDGPPATVAPLARYPALPRLAGRMARRFTVIVDDANRADETEMVKRWRDFFPAAQVTDCNCEKGCIMLEVDQEQGDSSVR